VFPWTELLLLNLIRIRIPELEVHRRCQFYLLLLLLLRIPCFYELYCFCDPWGSFSSFLLELPKLEKIKYKEKLLSSLDGIIKTGQKSLLLMYQFDKDKGNVV
jgi:hypothetical protein